MHRYLKLVERWRYGLLLGLLFATIMLQPVLNAHMLGQGMIVFAFGAILVGGVHVSRPSRFWLTICWVLTVVVVVLSWFTILVEAVDFSAELITTTLLLGVFTITRTLAALFSKDEVDSDTLASAVFGYFLLIVVWALFYRALDFHSPGAFNFATEGDQFTDLLYFSLVTITTLGYGDIVPVAPIAKISAGLEAAVGTLYLTILIARIVGTLNISKL